MIYVPYRLSHLRRRLQFACHDHRQILREYIDIDSNHLLFPDGVIPGVPAVHGVKYSSKINTGPLRRIILLR